ncbi:MAG: TolC family protein [Candidatus Cryptobacteroides sp.]
MRKSMIMAVLLVFPLAATNAQNTVDQVLAEIEKNNSELAALRARTEADKYSYKSGNALDDPEFGFDYLWSNPDVGGRKDFSVTQTLDMAVLFGSKGRLAATRSEFADMQYNVERQRVLLDAKTVFIELVYCNAMRRELSLRLEHSEGLFKAYQKMLEQGETGKAEANAARLAMSSARGEYSRNEIERSNLLEELRRLNGGNAIVMETDEYESTPLLPEDFDVWYAECAESSPVLAYVAQNVKVREQEMKTEKAANAPKITAGYMSELVKGSNFRGLTLGVSIPLWSVKNNVRQAKASYEASRLEQEDAVLQYYTQMHKEFDKALGLQELLYGYDDSLQAAEESAGLIDERFAAGETSLTECLMELGMYYNIVDQTLAAERDYQLALARLESYRL